MLGEKYSTGEDAGYLQLDEKTPGALLQLDIENVFDMRSIVVRGLMVRVSALIYSTVK